jgi:hypothetical protein
MDEYEDDGTRWGGRRASDAEHITLDTLYAALKHSGPYDPRPVTFETHGHLLLDADAGIPVPDIITIQVFITAIRVVMHPDYEYPEWYFEGWVKDDNPAKTWLRGILRVVPGVTDKNGELECGLYRLEPGEEWGDRHIPGFD